MNVLGLKGKGVVRFCSVTFGGKEAGMGCCTVTFGDGAGMGCKVTCSDGVLRLCSVTLYANSFRFY